MNKRIRELVYNKYNGRCAYCGCKIDYKDMQVDQTVPISITKEWRGNRRVD